MPVQAVERQVMGNRRRGNRDIRGRDGDAFGSEGAAQRGCGKVCVFVHFEIRESAQPIPDGVETSAVSYPLENFLENEAAERGPVMLANQGFEFVHDTMPMISSQLHFDIGMKNR
jgi:hypothetical protein